MRNTLAVVLALGGFVTTGRAQSRAEVTDQIMVMQMGMETDTMDVHTISANGRERVDTHARSGMLAQMWGPNFSQIVSTDTAMGIIFLNHEKKTYSTFNPMAMFDSAGSFAGGVTGAKLAPTEDSSTVDSLGAGPVVAGHATLHYRTRTVMHMSMAFMDQSMTVRSAITSDLFVAPDLPTESDTARARLTRSLIGPGSTMPGVGKKMAGAAAEIAKKGTMLRMSTENVTQIGGMTQTQRMTVETLSYKKMVVPDSLFVIPAGYTKSEDLFGGFH